MLRHSPIRTIAATLGVASLLLMGPTAALAAPTSPTSADLADGQTASAEPAAEPGSDSAADPSDDPTQSTTTRADATADSTAITINEVTSDADTIELFNSSDADVDVAGWLQNDSSHTPEALEAPDGTVVPAQGFLTIDSNEGLSNDGDAVKLYLADGSTLVDEVSWQAMEAEPGSLSRCGDGEDNWLHTEQDSFGESNSEACSGRIIDRAGDVPCQTEPPSDLGDPMPGGEAWPGRQDWTVADEQCQFDSAVSGQDVSGLDIDPSQPNVMWAVKNKNHVYRLLKDGDLWVKDSGNGWAEGKDPVFPGDTDPETSQPDTEGITVGPDGFLYMTTERDNTDKHVALDSILRFDPNEEGSVLHPTDQWVVTKDLAEVIDPTNEDDANLGFEGITWVPDSILTARGFIDDNTGKAYDPTDYPGHGSGLFFTALEKNGHLYPYALSSDGSYTRVADIDTGMPRIADVQWDGEAERIWAVADDSVGGSTTLMNLEDGTFGVDRIFDRPTGLDNLNLEGFAITPDSTCVDGQKEVIRSDDGNNGGHSLWSGTVDCDLVEDEAPTTDDAEADSDGQDNPADSADQDHSADSDNAGADNADQDDTDEGHAAQGNAGQGDNGSAAAKGTAAGSDSAAAGQGSTAVQGSTDTEATAAGSATLPRTGSDFLVPGLTAGIVLAAGGAGLAFFARRRRNGLG